MLQYKSIKRNRYIMATTPELTTPNPDKTISPELKANYTLTTVEEWRDAETSVLNHMRGNASDMSSYVTDFHSGVEQRVDEFLQEKGIKTGDPGYDELRALLLETRLRDKTAGRGFTNSEWNYSPASRGIDPPDTKPMRDVFAEKISSWQTAHEDATAPETPGSDEPIVSASDPERLADLDKKLAEAKELKHNAYVGAVNSKFRDREITKQEYEEAENAYVNALIAKIMLETEGMPEDERRARIIDLVNERVEQDKLAQQEYLVEQGGFKARMLQKYSKLTRKQKILTGLGIGLLGTGLGFAAGAIVGGVAAISGGATIAARRGLSFSNAYFSRLADRYNGVSGTEKLVIANDDTRDTEVIVREHIANEIRKDLAEKEEIRKRAVRGALGSVALGGALGFLGAGVGMALHTGHPIPSPFSEAGHSGPQNNHYGYGFLDREHRGAAKLVTGSGSDTGAKAWDVQVPKGDLRGGVTPPPAPGDILKDYLGNHNIDTTITYGEGMSHQFGQMGIPSEYHTQIMNDIGPKWHDSGWTYKMPNGNWGWSHTGALPTDLTRDIATSAQGHGFNLASAFEQHSNAELPIRHGDGVISLVQHDYGVTLTPDQAHNLADAMQVDGSGMIYDSTALQNAYGVEDGVHFGTGQIHPDDDVRIREYLHDNHFKTDAGTEVTAPKVEAAAPAPNTANAPTNIDQLKNPDNLQGIQEAQTLDTPLDELQTKFKSVVRQLHDGHYDDINKDNSLQDTLGYVAHDIGDTKYDGSDVPIITRNVDTHRWVINPMPEGATLPNSVKVIIDKYEQALYGLAS